MVGPGASAEHNLAQLVALAAQLVALAGEVRKVYLQDPADATRLAEFDLLFTAPLVLDTSHHEVHEGSAFAADIADLSLALAATLVLAFKTMAGTNRAHMVMEFSTLTGGHVDLIEAPTWDNQSGTKQPIFNRKREASMKSSGLLEDQAQVVFVASDNVILNPTGLAGGTVLHTVHGFGKKEKFPAMGRDVSEWVLKPDTQYAIRFTSDAGSNKADLDFNWYEHTDE